MGLKTCSFILGLLLLSASVYAATSATQSVTIQVNPINELRLGGSPGSLVVDGAPAGQEPAPATDTNSNYSFSTNELNRKVTAQIDTNMPAETMLEVQLASPGGSWSSSGKQPLSTSAVTLAQGGRGRAQNRTITYTFSATVNAAAGTGSRIVTFTVTSL